MKSYFDSSVLVGSVLARHPHHKICTALLEQIPDKISCAHALAETFVTLTATYKVPNDLAARQALALREAVRIESLTLGDYETAMTEARQRGVMGGGLYDLLHAVFARRHGAKRIFTLNVTDFRHVAPELEIAIF
jgi:predicted nucleic acid-binding protein